MLLALCWTHLNHIARNNYFSSRVDVATYCYDDDLLNQLGLLNDIWWLFARAGMGQFIEMKDHTYGDLTLELLSTLHVEVTQGPRWQEAHIFFYLQWEFYELNLGALNDVFGFQPCLDLP